MLKRFLLVAIFASLLMGARAQNKTLFNKDWEFTKDADTSFSAKLLQKNGPIKWQQISLPHTANIEPIEKTAQQWQGICFYRKFFIMPKSDKGKHIAIQFDAAMQKADVYLNGKHIFQHLGGYLPFYIDISKEVKLGAENSIVVKLDNRDNPLIPPGKSLKDLDFNYYSGLYRNAYLIVTNKLYISDAVAANRKAGGGIFTHYEKVNGKSATLMVQTELKNDYNTSKEAQVRISVLDSSGKKIIQSVSEKQAVEKAAFGTFRQTLNISNPELWSPEHPYLYKLSVEVLSGGKISDRQIITTGIKSIRFEAGAFYLNGEKLNIRGTNRHQEYPYIGYALSDNAQYRDAWKIKQVGFNFVRCSHYPQSPAFLAACDELGIMVMDAIPGWQFFGNEEFQQNSFQNIRDMIHRDRNHVSVILWEASLNESGMSKPYMEKANQIVHEELPFEQTYTAGWIDYAYDVFIPARQHAKAPAYWNNYKKDKPLLIAEYGDWEYYAQNAGFSQTEFKDLKEDERSSRQLRGFGEKRLLQQALNFQESHNDNLNGPAVGDANWLMFDYKRGYAPDIESSGIMDITRLPKFSFYFYQSLAGPDNESAFHKPMLFIANYWNSPADTTVKIYSNCEEVTLFLNGKLIAKQYPDKGKYSTNLKHSPFTFNIKQFEPGTLKAIAYINGKEVLAKEQKTPQTAAKIRLRADYSGRELQAGQNDIIFIYADIVDGNGTIVPSGTQTVEFNVQGNAVIVGLQKVKAEAGIATALLKAGDKPGTIKISAAAGHLKSEALILNSK